MPDKVLDWHTTNIIGCRWVEGTNFENAVRGFEKYDHRLAIGTYSGLGTSSVAERWEPWV